MNRWLDIPAHLGQGLRSWQVVYMIVFAVYATCANLYVGPMDQPVGDIYLLMSVASLFIVLPNFRRSLFRSSDPLRNHSLSGAPFAKFGWRVYLYILVPAFFVALLQSFSAVMSLFLQFNQTNVSSSPTIGDYVTACAAGMEEVWRWSMIGAVVVILRGLLRRIWSKPIVRATGFSIAFGMSSLAFGAGHILEFDVHRLRAWLLFSGLGALLALMTIVTGRILLVICVHIAYDLWITYLSSVSGPLALIGALIYIALLVAPLVTLLWRRSLFRTESGLADPARYE